ncbi:MAG: hypothetical protein NZ608_04370 [candidate division WOR-3 bacterium]|nr:hypothetical protein [candidate division WOR-3 bacterium]
MPDSVVVRKPGTLTLEKVLTGRFSGDDSFWVYYTDQFFINHPQGSNHSLTFAQYVKEAAIESWQKQVVEWDLGLPPDANRWHKFFINNTQHWYHGIPSTYSDTGPNRKIFLQYDIWEQNQNYSNEDSIIRAVIAHEFYHGIQWGLSSKTLKKSSWRYFTEGQAVFIQTVQCPKEEFIDEYRRYPLEAFKYLWESLNTSLRNISYPFCLYWRFLFEKFFKNGDTKTKLSVIKECII